MVKTKGKRKGLSDFKNNPSRKAKGESNPFEVHVNRQKFAVLGRKLKTDRGLPGLSRAKSIKKRKETLLQEYKIMGKSNKFLDRRIGEFDKDMTEEDKIMARFAAERASSHRKQSMFNLADDEPLTHRGRSIMEIETFEDPPSEEDDDFFDKRLDGKFVEEAHFGGGMLKKADGSRMAVIDQLIADSKVRKAEKAAAKEQTLAATERLDKEWRDLLPVLGAGGGQAESEDTKKDEYDKILNQLRFEPRGTPTDRLKSENEVAETEAKRLRELEEDRLRRMSGETANAGKKPASVAHRSADDLDDGFDLSDAEEEEDFILTYDKDGKPVGLPKEKKRELEEINDYEEVVDEESDDSDDSEAEDDFSDLKPVANDESDQETGDEEDDKKRKQDDKASDEDDSGVKAHKIKKTVHFEEDESTKAGEPVKKKVSFKSDVDTVVYSAEPEEPKTIEELEKMKKDNERLMNTARDELPYTFIVPDEYEELEELLRGKSLVQQTVVIERMIKCTHPSLKEGNRSKLEILFTFLLQRLNDAEYAETWTTLDSFAPYLYDLTQLSPEHAADSLCDVLSEKFSDCLKRKGHYPYPGTLVFLKLVPLLFPPSDKRHRVTTPAFAFLLHLLATCRPNTRRGIAVGLFLCSLLTQYVSLSKRIAPDAIAYLNGVLQMCCVQYDSQYVPPFRPEYKMLCLESDISSYEGSCKMSLLDLGCKGTRIDDVFRARAVFSALTTLETFASCYAEKPGIFLLFEGVSRTLQYFKAFDRYPQPVRTKIERLTSMVDELKAQTLPPLETQDAKPKSLRMYEPNIQPVYDRNKISDDRIRMKRRVKKETKGALREIRKDRTFLAGIKFREQKASDVERIRKVKEIYGWGAEQQGELNKLDRIKKRKKFKR